MSKPTLGYASRTAAVQALRAQGMSTRQIAERVGIEEKTVAALECSSARQGARVREFATTTFAKELRNRAAVHAARRNITVNELFRRIVEAVIDDGMVDAVLDDRGQA